MTEKKPSIPYWRLWTDGEGVSRQSRCAMTAFELRTIGAPAQPQWLGRATCGLMTVRVTVLPVGWVGDWHENPKPQWIVPMSGRWFVESMNGERVEFGSGDISFGGDQNCREIDGRRGHRSGTVGDAAAVLMLMQYEEGRGPPSSQFD